LTKEGLLKITINAVSRGEAGKSPEAKIDAVSQNRNTFFPSFSPPTNILVHLSS